MRSSIKKDAQEYAKAYVATGEGAGNRRKLATTIVAYRTATIPGYKDRFDEELSKIDLADLAVKERRHINYQNVGAATGATLLAAIYISNKIGATPVIVDWADEKITKASDNIHRRIQKFKNRRNNK